MAQGETGKPVTELQFQTLELIARYVIVNGWGPTIRELRDGIGVKSLNSASSRLDALERHEFVVRAGVHRTIRITRAGYLALARRWGVHVEQPRPRTFVP